MTHIWRRAKKWNHPYGNQPCNILVWRKRKALVQFEDGYKMMVYGNLRRIADGNGMR